MPFCDTMCTGVAAISLTSNVAAQYGTLSNQLISNGQSIANLSSTIIDQQASIYSAEYEAHQARVAAYDAMGKVINGDLEKNSITFERMIDNLVSQIFILKKSLRVGDLAVENSKRANIENILTVNNTLIAIPQLAKAIEQSKIQAKESSAYQIKMSQHIGDNNLTNQKLALLRDVDFDIPNPFTAESISKENWIQYQKQLFLTFNMKPFTSNNTLSERQAYLKRQYALSIISKVFSEFIEVPDNEGDDLALLTGKNNSTVKEAMFEQYRQHLNDINVQTNTKTAPIDSLLIMANLQLAQKNMLLREIANTKRLKNSLLALSII